MNSSKRERSSQSYEGWWDGELDLASGRRKNRESSFDNAREDRPIS